MNVLPYFVAGASSAFTVGSFIFDLFPAAQYVGAGALLLLGLTLSFTSHVVSPLSILLLASYWALAVANSLFSQSPLAVFVKYGLVAAIYWAILRVSVAGGQANFLNGFKYTALLILALAAVFSDESPDTLRRTFLGIHPNLVGLFSYVLGLVFIVLHPTWGRRIPGLVFCLFVAAHFSSRASFIALSIAAAVTLLTEHGKGKLALLALITILALSLLPVLSDVLMLDDEHRGIDSGFSGRTEYWASALSVFYDKPMLGAGFGIVESLLDIPVDNGYVLMLAETGLLGVLMFVAAACYYLTLALRVKRTHPMLASSALAVLVSFLFYIFFERRYLAAGNPLSILVMLMFASVQWAARQNSTRLAHDRCGN